MTDIVERLRGPMVEGLTHPLDKERREAADEIERLRAAKQCHRCIGCKQWLVGVNMAEHIKDCPEHPLTKERAVALRRLEAFGEIDRLNAELLAALSKARTVIGSYWPLVGPESEPEKSAIEALNMIDAVIAKAREQS